jgi:hypothetical protein
MGMTVGPAQRSAVRAGLSYLPIRPRGRTEKAV